MADLFSKKQRSYNMSKIRSKGSATTEKTFSKLLRASRIKGWRCHLPLPGKPDFVFLKKKAIVFVDGCFWHHHKNCIDGKIPKTRKKYWTEKLAKNVERDKKNTGKLRRMGWKVIRFWECQVLNNQQRIIEKTKELLSR